MNRLKAYLGKFIRHHMADYANNNLKLIDRRAFGTPIVGFSRADDPWFQRIREHIDPERYLSACDWLRTVYDEDFDPADVSIVSWVLPQLEETRAECHDLDDCSSFSWQMARVHGEDCNRALAAAVEAELRRLGIKAVSPMISPVFTQMDSEEFVRISNWSERHTAFVAGLGTFGLCGGLITPVGKAVRIGSVIFARSVRATPRPYTRYNEYCLADKGCTACIRRCPAGAITAEGRDKQRCIDYFRDVIGPICHERYQYDGYSVCGLCQTAVPCEHRIPKHN